MCIGTILFRSLDVSRTDFCRFNELVSEFLQVAFFAIIPAPNNVLTHFPLASFNILFNHHFLLLFLHLRLSFLNVAGHTASINTRLREWQISIYSYPEHATQRELSERQLLEFVARPSSLQSLYLIPLVL